jgi:hypothetical protein
MSNQCGPIRSFGRSWGGIIERTEALWIVWITAAARQIGVSPESLELRFHGVDLIIARVALTFGPRYYWLCPLCQRRCEAVYHLNNQVGCRQCLHLGYLSQSYRPFSSWGELDRLFTRRFLSRGRRGDRHKNESALAGVVAEVRAELHRQLVDLIAGVEISISENGGIATDENKN